MKTLEKVSLFWDVDRATLGTEAHADFIIRRVLMFGDLEDVKWVVGQYGVEKVRDVAQTARDLDSRSRAFWTAHFAHA
ncbi:hypothetical protein EBR66_01700 [bacterium]|nr:hypothetical protein [bacterium]